MTDKLPMYMDIDMPFCPTCGRENLFRESPEWLLGLFTGMFARVLAVMLASRRRHRALGIKEIVAYVYADKASKPAEGGKGGVLASIKRNRAKLAHCGWAIVSHHTTGRGYQLVRLEQAEENTKRDKTLPVAFVTNMNR